MATRKTRKKSTKSYPKLHPQHQKALSALFRDKGVAWVMNKLGVSKQVAYKLKNRPGSPLRISTIDRVTKLCSAHSGPVQPKTRRSNGSADFSGLEEVDGLQTAVDVYRLLKPFNDEKRQSVMRMVNVLAEVELLNQKSGSLV